MRCRVNSTLKYCSNVSNTIKLVVGVTKLNGLKNLQTGTCTVCLTKSSHLGFLGALGAIASLRFFKALTNLQ